MRRKTFLVTLFVTVLSACDSPKISISSESRAPETTPSATREDIELSKEIFGHLIN